MKNRQQRLNAMAHFFLRHELLIKQFIQYIVVGGGAFVVDFGLLSVLTELVHLHYLLSATIGFIGGLMVNYLLCIVWIFDHRSVDKVSHEFAIFAMIGILGLVLNNLLIYSLTEWFSIHYLISKIASAMVVLIFNFGFRRFFLFTSGTPLSDNEKMISGS